MTKKSRTTAYFLWLVGGWFGLYFIYLGRDKQALLWWCTLGGLFGLGWLGGFFCIGRYVDKANHYLSYFEYPSFLSRMADQVFGGVVFGFLMNYALYMFAVKNDFVDAFPFLRLLLVPIAVSSTVHLVGFSGGEEASFKFSIIGAYFPFILQPVDPNNRFVRVFYQVTFRAFSSAVFFRFFITFTKTKCERTIGTYERLVICGFVALGATACGCAVYDNMPEAAVMDALSRFFEYQEWKKLENFAQKIWILILEWKWNKSYSESGGKATASKILFQILELEEGATQEEVTKQYRKLALKWHPDKQKDKEEATRRFMEIHEAYETLSIANIPRAGHSQEHDFD